MEQTSEETIGIRIPLTLDRVDGLRRCRDEDEMIRQSIRMILTTRPGTRPLAPGYGCRLHEYLFRPLNPMFRSAVTFFVEQALAEWEPRIRVMGVSIHGGEEPGTAVIVVSYEYQGKTMSLPIQMREGAVETTDEILR